jgi:hypothetical protein
MTTEFRAAYQTAVLTLVSAVVFAAAFQFNSWIFSALEYRTGINWVFLPSGFRVVLVLVLRIPGAIGIMLGSWFIDRASLMADVNWLILLNGIVSGWTPWLVQKWLEKRKLFGARLDDMTSQKLLTFTVVYSAANACAHHSIWVLMHRTHVNWWIDVWPMFVGDAAGALLILYAWKLSVKFAKHWQVGTRI